MMRLVEVEIENYKQYAGAHRFHPGEKAMVAVVGQNGAGKTTLFEAIEWCLYNPSRIKNDTLTPRVQGGKPRVRVVIEDPQTGVVYEVERTLKGGSTQAEIYRQDKPDSPIVQGTRQVTEYVARELTGLSHTAFAATFFTRQKELSFFGDMGATQRREQVGRLLGLETIRVAQKRIGEQRARKQAEARVKRELYESQSSGVDFPAERERLNTLIGQHASERDAAKVEEALRKEQTASASAERDKAQDRFATHAALQQQFAHLQGEQRRITALREAAEQELAAIAEAEREIVRQQAAAASEPELLRTLAVHEAKRAKLETVNRLGAELQQLLVDRQAIAAIVANDRNVSEQFAGETEREAQLLVVAFDTAISQLAGIDLEGARSRRDAARKLIELDARRTEAQDKLETMEQLATDLTKQMQAIEAGGLPVERLGSLQTSRAELLQYAAAANSLASQTEERAKALRQLEQNLQTSELGEVCPTCARPFQPGEATRTLAALAEQIRLLVSDVSTGRSKARDFNEQASQLAKQEAELTEENETYLRISGRLANGRSMIETQMQDVSAIATEFSEQLRGTPFSECPTGEAYARLLAEVEQAETSVGQLPRLEVGREQLVSSIERQAGIARQISEFGTVAYDAEAHRRDHAAWSVARDAVARIEALQRQVAHRPEREAVVEQATVDLQSLVGQRARVDEDIARLQFDMVEVDRARQATADALERERAATQAAHLAEKRFTDAQRELADLVNFETQLKTLRSESDAADVSAGELDLVYREFARFEKFVAVAVTPVLGEIASELLDKATDGKYDRLEFTEDYGIEVYDGDNDRFPLNEFSGGERDVIALCARLALSQVIGGQSATPIKFMVLDEVFGSLDLDRRRNLMEMLQRLMEENQAFQQLFVISHVDDVRAASMFDEVWRVSESSDGVSQLEQVSVTGTLEDY